MSTTSGINVLSSSLDVQSIVDNLIYVDRAPVRTMESQRTKLQNQSNAFQTFNTKVSSLLNKVNQILFRSDTAPMILPYSFEDRLAKSIFTQMKVASSDESVISASTGTGTAGGNYTILVDNLAQARSAASSNFADTTTAKTGTGTITLSGASESPVTITIDETNNTLAGIRKAINASNAGVSATIVSDGSANPYRLLITSNKTGLSNAFTLTDTLSGGQALAMTEQVAAADAKFSVNGISMSSSTNVVADQIPGLTFTLKAKSANPVTLDLTLDTDSVITAMKALVSAYNEVNTFINSQFTYNATTKTAGLLSGDSTLRNVQSTLQSKLVQSVANRFTSLGVIGQVGLQFNRDGSLTLDEAKLGSVLTSKPTDLAALFLGEGTVADGVSATDSRITSATKTAATQAGSYDVTVTSLAQKAVVTANQSLMGLTLSGDETLTISLGSVSQVVSLGAGDSLSAVLGKINTTLTSAGLGITAADDGTGKIQLTSSAYGSSQAISVVSTVADAQGSTGFGQVLQSASGADIAGTIGGVAATGNGTVLTGAAATAQEGLSLRISQSIIGNYGSVTVAPPDQGSQGASVLLSLYSSLKGIADPLSGPIHHSSDSLSMTIRDLTDRIDQYESRLETLRAQYTAQFQKADEALRLLTVNQANLTAQMDSLKSI
jgi:flagellar hook-associated protein 2